MKCIYCKKEIRDNATYCSECGRLQNDSFIETADNTRQANNLNSAITYIIKNRKKILILALIILVVIVGVNIINGGNKKEAIVGTWKTDNGYEISFSSNKKFTKGSSTSGTYEIYDKNKLVMVYQGFDYIDRNTWTYEWSKENKGMKDYWYISNNTLYIGTDMYIKE